MRWDKIWKPGGREEIKFGANFVFYYFPLTGSLSSVPRSFCCSFVEIHQVLDDDTVHLLVTWCNIDTQCPDWNSATLCRHNNKLGIGTVYNIYYRYIYIYLFSSTTANSIKYAWPLVSWDLLLVSSHQKHWGRQRHLHSFTYLARIPLLFASASLPCPGVT